MTTEFQLVAGADDIGIEQVIVKWLLTVMSQVNCIVGQLDDIE